MGTGHRFWSAETLPLLEKMEFFLQGIQEQRERSLQRHKAVHFNLTFSEAHMKEIQQMDEGLQVLDEQRNTR